ncbi:MAG: hypothetical protein AAB391_02430 [Patescibacteria group bacterium]
MDPLYVPPRTFDTQGFAFTLKWGGLLLITILIGRSTYAHFSPSTDSRNARNAQTAEETKNIRDRLASGRAGNTSRTPLSVIDSAAKPKLAWLEKPTIRLSAKIARPQNISATAFLIADADTGQVLISRQPALSLPIASLTKLVTALTAHRYGAPSPVQELFYPLLMESSNVAADQIAGVYDGLGNVGYFVSQMNRQAALLDMTHTYFADPSGLSAENQSTAYDLLLLAKSIKDLAPDILAITKTHEKTVMLDSERSDPYRNQAASVYTAIDAPTYRDLQNINLFANDPRFLGGKTGFTPAAGETLISLFQLPIQKSSRSVVFILLGSDNREKDFGILMKWLELATK